ncbi:hypothetical protein KL914_002749 [Ogataea haglerorum]|uniref:Phytanoyl-CoA dioxygenase n=1 Tax=Ogataea haglerorum TaxID=1937702 RepID=A0ABQ7RI85_9ASCO|nr:hypothetical protein KL914_002749 [Ogataea haglerorum]KAG7766058.1 hypothetical protein KL946_002238 [Ogataea haglerorum]
MSATTTVTAVPIAPPSTVTLEPAVFVSKREFNNDKIKTVIDRIAQKTYGDWRDDLFRDGYAVVKNAVPRERAQQYQQEAFKWLGRFSDKFDIRNPDTWTRGNLPPMSNTNIFKSHCVSHEKFMWDARLEPGVIKAFERLWQTDQLLVSFDALNVTLPHLKDKEAVAPWPHVDQTPYRKGMHCAQGIISLSDHGPEDGGLVVYKGTHELMEEFFTSVVPKKDWTERDFFMISDEQLQWFLDRGCEEIKIECEAGDLIIWDSRTIHWGKEPSPSSNTIRTVIYACYTPAHFATEKSLAEKKSLFESWSGTTHWPHDNLVRTGRKAYYADGRECENNRDEPFEKPALTDELLRLAGVKPYENK